MWNIRYSQIELRVQANYTIEVSGGDLNLCRAYIPFKCFHYKTGQMFDFNNKKHREYIFALREGHPDPKLYKKGIKDVLKEGWSIWVHQEDGKHWVPVDLHSKTTSMAYPDLDEDTDKFTHLRQYGKRLNFARLLD
jgi:DNA polymerase-1